MRVFYQQFILLLAIAIANIASADGLLLDGQGARATGRGGTNLGWADSGTILYDNPGGMVNIDCPTMVQADLVGLFVDAEYSDATTGIGDFDTNPVPIGNFSLLRKVNQDVAVGVGIFSAGGFATDWDTQGQPPFTGDRNYKSFGALAKVLPGVSLRLTNALSVGATLGVAIDHVELEGPYTLQSGALRGTPTLMDMQGTGAALTWSLGMQYQLSERTTLGAAYQSESRFRHEGTVKTEVPGFGSSAFDAEIRKTWPQTVGVGLRHKLCACRSVSVDVIYHGWQAAFDEVSILMDNATNPFLAAFGPIDERYPLAWRDSVSIRLGYERQLASGDRFRCGYVYHRNPIPTSTLTPYIVSLMEHSVSVGYGTQFRGWNVDFAYQLMFGGDASVGTSGIVGGDFDNAEYETRAHLLYVSLMRQ